MKHVPMLGLDTTYEELKSDENEDIKGEWVGLDTTYEELKQMEWRISTDDWWTIRYYLWGIEIVQGVV